MYYSSRDIRSDLGGPRSSGHSLHALRPLWLQWCERGRLVTRLTSSILMYSDDSVVSLKYWVLRAFYSETYSRILCFAIEINHIVVYVS